MNWDLGPKVDLQGAPVKFFKAIMMAVCYELLRMSRAVNCRKILNSWNLGDVLGKETLSHFMASDFAVKKFNLASAVASG